MAKTLDQLLAECGLATSGSEKEHEKVASAPVKDQVDQVLESLGLHSSATEEESVTKVASDNAQIGGSMGLQSIYEQMFGQEEHVEKVAAEAGSEEPTEEVTKEAGEETEENLFGQLVGHYFNAGYEAMFTKVASEDQQPLAHASTGGQLTGIIGSAKDPQLPVNADASSGKELKTMTGNSSPYALAAAGPAIKAVLKRKMKSDAGEVGGYHQT